MTLITFSSTEKKARKQDTIHLFCPDDRVNQLVKLLKYLNVELVINDYEAPLTKEKVICHYESSRLDAEKNMHLVNATESGVWVEPLVSYLDQKNGYTEVDLLHSSYFLHQKPFTILSSKRTQIVKRALDIIFSLLLILLALPIGILTAILIKLESKGPIFYKQIRTGQFNSEFKVMKFRSMCQNAEQEGAKWASKFDVRVTKVGKFIRKTRIDELPQLMNVLKGEMSLVGPRPEREVFISELEKRIPYYRFRHAVKPGITGLAQVSYPYGESVEDAVWKHKYDIHYIKHHRTITDLRILLKTIKVVLFGMGQ